MTPNYQTRIAAPLALALCGCADPNAQPVAWEGELLTVTSSDGIELCGGTLAFLDRFVGHTYEYWTQEAPPDEFALNFELRLDASGGSDRHGSALAYEGFAWISDQTVLIHELSHIVVGWDDGVSAPSLGEGIAEALGPVDLAGVWGPLLEQPHEYAFLPREDFYYPEGEFSARHYGPSAQLVRFLIDRYGVAVVRSAYLAARHDHASEEIEAAFLDVFGESLYESFDELVALPQQCGLQAWECSDAVVSVRKLPVKVERTVDCSADPGVIGATAPDSRSWFPLHQFTVDVATATEIIVDTADNATVQRMTCIATCADAPPAPVVRFDAQSGMGETVFESSWEAGRYVVSIRPIDPTLPFSATIREGE